MKLFRSTVIIIISIYILQGCEWLVKPGPCDTTGPVIVYKTKQDYFNKVTVQLSNDGKKITGVPDWSNAESLKPIQLEDDYLLKRMNGDAFLSITIEEYCNTYYEWPTQDLLDLVIDTEPYTEIYECCECTEGDTSLINILIRENRLGECENIK